MLCLAALGFAANAGANTSNGYNLPTGVTDLARDIYGLHMEVFWICVGIAVVVFGVMIYALVKFRHSQGAVADTTMLHSTKVEIIWTIIPVLILVVMAIPAAELILKMEDTRNSATVHPRHRIPVEMAVPVHGRGGGDRFLLHARARLEFRAPAATPASIRRRCRIICWRSINPLVIPSGTKVRLLLTSQDVIHAWWVPDFGAKRSAIPGFINELWFKVDPGKEGIYRGQCAALCGRDHGFMPVVVDVRTPDEFKKWVEEQKAAAEAGSLARAAGGAGTHRRPRRKLLRINAAILTRELSALWPTLTRPATTHDHRTTITTTRPGHGHQALAVRHQPQGHRHDVPGVQPDHVLHRRLHGDGDPRRAVQAGPAARRSGVLQSDDHQCMR